MGLKPKDSYNFKESIGYLFKIFLCFQNFLIAFKGCFKKLKRLWIKWKFKGTQKV